MILDDEGKIKEVVEKSLIEFYSTRNTSPKMPIESKLINAFVNSIFNDSLVDVYNKLKNYMSGDGKEFGFLKSYSSDIMYVPRKYWYIVAYAITRKDKTLFELVSRAFYDNENVTVDYGDPDGTYTDEDLLTDTGEHTDIILGLITVMFESFAYNNPVDITKYPRGSVAWEDWLEKSDVFDHLISIVHPARISVRNVPVLYGNKTLSYGTQDTDVNFRMPYPWDTFDEELFNNLTFEELGLNTTPRLNVPLIKYKKTKIDDNTIRHDMTFQGLTPGAESNPYDIGPVEYQASSMTYPIIYPFGTSDCYPVFKSYKTHLVSSCPYPGRIITSKDGATWTDKAVMNPSRSPFDKIIYCNKLQCYLGIVSYGIYKCTDPQMIVWEQVYLPTIPSELVTLRDIIYEKNKLIVVGDSGVILTSYDAITWTRRKISDKNLYKIAYGSKQDVFVIVGPGIILRSKDHGDSWSITIESGSYYLKSICYAENIDKFIIVAATVIYSLTGDASDLRSVAYFMMDDTLTDIAYSKDKGILVASVKGRYSSSIRWAYEKDVTIWSYVPINQGIDYLYYAPIRKIFLGGSHSVSPLMSEDGKNWVKGETPSNIPAYGFTEGVDLASIKNYTLNSVTATLENLAVPQSLYEDNNNRVRLVIDTILPQE